MVFQYPLDWLAEVRSKRQCVTKIQLLAFKHIQQDQVLCPSLQNLHRSNESDHRHIRKIDNRFNGY